MEKKAIKTDILPNISAQNHILFGQKCVTLHPKLQVERKIIIYTRFFNKLSL